MLRKILVTATICLPLVACESITGSSGDLFTPAALKQNLKIGVTTPEQVRSIYGTPDYTSEGPNGPEMYSYKADKLSNQLINSASSFLGISGSTYAADAATTNKELFVHFRRNRVSSYSLSDSKPR